MALVLQHLSHPHPIFPHLAFPLLPWERLGPKENIMLLTYIVYDMAITCPTPLGSQRSSRTRWTPGRPGTDG